tara:strand:- start:2469 stop:2627 length:159 start_codon:yes stop_codon:yes gene_type:complete
MMGISPSEFWNMGMPELMIAVDGFTEFNSGGKQESNALTKDELHDMMERYPD